MTQPGQKNWFLRHKVLGVAGAVVLIIVIASVAAESGSSKKASTTTPASAAAPVATSSATTAAPAVTSTPKSAPSHAEDVAIAACTPDELGNASAQVVVTNHSSKSSNYLITIAMESKDGKTQVGTGNVVVNNLGPGQASSPQTADSVTPAPPAGYTCRVADITRFAS